MNLRSFKTAVLINLLAISCWSGSVLAQDGAQGASALSVETPVLHTDTDFDASITYTFTLDNWARTAVFVNGEFSTCIDKATDWGLLQTGQTDVVIVPLDIPGIENTAGTYTIQTLTEPTNPAEASCTVAQIYYAADCPLGFCPSAELTVLATGAFTVSKDFSDDNPGDVDVEVTCSDFATISSDSSGTVSESADFVVDIQWDIADAEESDPTCTATETPVPGYTDDTADACTDVEIGSPDGDIPGSGACTLVNTQNPIVIEAAKVYASGGEAAVDFAISCSDLDEGGGVTPDTASATPGNPAIFTVNGVMWDGSSTCSVTEPIPPEGYTEAANTCTDLSIAPSDDPVTCEITNSVTVAPTATRATFKVTKYFADGNDEDEITVSIDCNTGLILDQDKDLEDGEWVEFVVTDYTDGTLNCTITEDGLAGYAGEYYNVTLDTTNNESCEYLDVTGEESAFECEITNSPLPVNITVTKDWIIEGLNNSVDQGFELDLYCQASGMTGSGAYNQYGNTWHGWDYGDGDDTFTWQIVPLFPTSSCYVQEYFYESHVEVDNGCGNLVASAGNGASCTITNTVFFEGIPTLSQYGMALMALLMLGVGFVGFRRFS